MSSAGVHSVSYSRSDRAMCKACKNPITKGSLRMGIAVHSSTFDGTFNTFYHFKCYMGRKTKKQITTDVIEGFKGIRWTDQNKIRKEFHEEVKEELTGKPTLEQLAAKWKTALTPAEENELDWQIRELVDAKCSLAEVKEQLLLNNQPIHGGEEDIFRRFAQGCVYGALEKCPSCKEGHLHWEDVKEVWKCNSYTDAWSQCGYTSAGFSSAKRTPFVLNYTNNPAFKHIAQLFGWPKPQAQSSFLADLHVAVSGRIGRTKQDLIEFLHRHSAIFDPSVTENTSIVVASENTYYKGNSMLTKASGMGIPLVDEKYLDQCLCQKTILPTDEYLLSNPKKAPGDALLGDSGAPSSSDAATAASSNSNATTFNDYQSITATDENEAPVGYDNHAIRSSGGLERDDSHSLNLVTSQMNSLRVSQTAANKYEQLSSALELLDEADGSTSVGIALAQSFFDPFGKTSGLTKLDVGRFNVKYIRDTDSSSDSNLLLHDCALGFVAFDPICTTVQLPAAQRTSQQQQKTIAARPSSSKLATTTTAGTPTKKQPRKLVPGQTFSVISKKFVDPESKKTERYHIYEEATTADDLPVLYNLTLNQTDISSGSNSYYCMQLLVPDSPNSKTFYVWTKWGRVGTKIGSTKLAEFAQLPRALKEFQDKFYQKTRNRWTEYTRKAFVKYGGAYCPLEIEYEEEDDQDKRASKVAKQVKPSTLDVRVQPLMEMLFDVSSMEKAMSGMSLNTKEMPLGKLSKAAITQGYTVLTEIEKILLRPASDTAAFSTTGQSATDSFKTNLTDQDVAKLLSLSNRFYTLIPHNFGMKKPPIIDNIDLLREKLEMLSTLSDIEIASSLLNESNEDDELHPLDKNYAKLNNNITPLDKSSLGFRQLCEYLQNAHSLLHSHFRLNVKDIFELDREGEAEAFRRHECLRNRMLLWHGSRMSNWAGILSQGLRIAPPEAPHSGYKFGKGVYHANIASMSAEFGHPASFNNQILLLVSEVALGEQHVQFEPKYLTKEDIGMLGKNSTYALGKYSLDPKMDRTFDNSSTIIPLGKEVPLALDCPQDHPEFVVYDTSQVKQRFLVWAEYKRGKN